MVIIGTIIIVLLIIIMIDIDRTGTNIHTSNRLLSDILKTLIDEIIKKEEIRKKHLND